MKQVRAAIIGFGSSAQFFHLPAIAREPSLRLSVAFDPIEHRRSAARTSGIPDVRTPEGLTDAIRELSLDVVIVCSPNSVHYTQARAAIAAGAHVVVEKPVVFDGEQFKSLHRFAQLHRRLLVPFHNRAFDSDHQIMVEEIRKGTVGHVVRVDLTAAHQGHWTHYAVADFFPQWRTERAWGGGVWNDWGPHLVDQMLRLVGRGKPQTLYARFYAPARATVESSAMVQLHWSSTTGRILISACEASPAERCRVVGTHGVIVSSGSESSGAVIIDTAEGTRRLAYESAPDAAAVLYHWLINAINGEHRQTEAAMHEAQDVYDVLGEVRNVAT